jgi:hypothetical protein
MGGVIRTCDLWHFLQWEGYYKVPSQFQMSWLYLYNATPAGCYYASGSPHCGKSKH